MIRSKIYGRRQHNAGLRHQANIRSYYQQFPEKQAQSLIDQRVKDYHCQAAAIQIGAQFNQPIIPGTGPPVLPTRTTGAAGYPGGIPTRPPGAPFMPMQMAPLPSPPLSARPVAPVPAINPVMYQPAQQPGSAIAPHPQNITPPSPGTS